MGNKSATILAEVIRKPNGTLRDLDLSNNLFIMDDIEVLGHAYKESTIECLNLRSNIISGEEICAFEQLLAPICNMTKRKFMFWTILMAKVFKLSFAYATSAYNKA